MSERNFHIGDRNEHGLYPFSKIVVTHNDAGEPVIQPVPIGDLTPAECDEIEEQLHQRRAERD